jgi:hypothetical protein
MRGIAPDKTSPPNLLASRVRVSVDSPPDGLSCGLAPFSPEATIFSAMRNGFEAGRIPLTFLDLTDEIVLPESTNVLDSQGLGFLPNFL